MWFEKFRIILNNLAYLKMKLHNDINERGAEKALKLSQYFFFFVPLL
jgi:hypothetical protein